MLEDMWHVTCALWLSAFLIINVHSYQCLSDPQPISLNQRLVKRKDNIPLERTIKKLLVSVF